MNKGKKRLAIVGSGFGAKFQLPILASMPLIDVVGISDNGSGNAKNNVDLLNLSIPTFSNWENLLSEVKPEIVVVTVPPKFHKEICLAAIKAGADVLCEKPFTLSFEEACEIYSVASINKRQVSVDYEFRYELGIQKLKELIDLGKLGDVKSMTVHWFSSGRASLQAPWSWKNSHDMGGGVLNEFASHCIDYLSWIIGKSPSLERAYCETRIKQRPSINDPKKLLIADAEDYCELELRFDDGIDAAIICSNVATENIGHTITVKGSRGQATLMHSHPYRGIDTNLKYNNKAHKDDILFDLRTDSKIDYTIDSRHPAFIKLMKDFLNTSNDRITHSQALPTIFEAIRVRKLLDIASRKN